MSIVRRGFVFLLLETQLAPCPARLAVLLPASGLIEPAKTEGTIVVHCELPASNTEEALAHQHRRTDWVLFVRDRGGPLIGLPLPSWRGPAPSWEASRAAAGVPPSSVAES